MLTFWRNPEFVRYARAELRATRVLMALFVTLIVCLLIGMSTWSAMRFQPRADFFRTYYEWLFGIQASLLALWCLTATSQAISGEREMKTWDFQRTTRLAAGEMLLGKLLGVPIMAYTVAAGALPVTVASGLLGGYSVGTIAGSYVLVVVFVLFLSLGGLWISMLMEKPSRGSWVLAWFLLYPIFGIASVPRNSLLPGLAALSPLPGIVSLHGGKGWWGQMNSAPLFGVDVPIGIIHVVLYATMGAWMALMIVRNLKRDLDQMRLLSRWQAIGLTFYLNVLFYSLLNLDLVKKEGPHDLVTAAVVLNSMALFAVGLATLTPYERLKVWWRARRAQQEKYLSEDGLPWPWMALAAGVAFALLVVEAVALSGALPFGRWGLKLAALQLLVLAVFAVRDVLFLQWCNLTHMRNPVSKGFMLLCLYYVAVLIVGIVVEVGSSRASEQLLAALTPWMALDRDKIVEVLPALAVGLAVQGGVIALLMRKIVGRVERPAAAALAH